MNNDTNNLNNQDKENNQINVSSDNGGVTYYTDTKGYYRSVHIDKNGRRS